MAATTSFDIHPDNFLEAFGSSVFVGAVLESDNTRTTLEQVTSNSPFDPSAVDSTVAFGDPEQDPVCIEASSFEFLTAVDPSYTYNFDEFVFAQNHSGNVQLKKIIVSSGHGSVAWQDYQAMTCKPNVVRTYTSEEPKEAVDARVAKLSEGVSVGVNKYSPTQKMDFDYSYLEIQFDAVAKDAAMGMVSCVLRLNPDGHLIAGGLTFVCPQEIAASKSEIIAQIRKQVGLPIIISDEERAAAPASVPAHDYLSRMDVTQERSIKKGNDIVLTDEATARYTVLADALTSAETLAVVEERGKKTEESRTSVSREYERTVTGQISASIFDMDSNFVFNSQVLVSAHHLQREKNTVVNIGTWEEGEGDYTTSEYDNCDGFNSKPNCVPGWVDVDHYDPDYLHISSTEEKTDTIDDTWSYTFKSPIDVPRRNGTLSTTTSCTLEVTDVQDPVVSGLFLSCKPVRGVGGKFYPEITLEQAAQSVYQALNAATPVPQ